MEGSFSTLVYALDTNNAIALPVARRANDSLSHAIDNQKCMTRQVLVDEYFSRGVRQSVVRRQTVGSASAATVLELRHRFRESADDGVVRGTQPYGHDDHGRHVTDGHHGETGERRPFE